MELCPKDRFSYYLFPLTGRSPHFRPRALANHLASLFFPPVRRFVRATVCHSVSHSLSTRSPSTNICFSFNSQPKLTQFFVSLLTVSLWRLANSHTGNSSNLISIFSVGHHVTPISHVFEASALKGCHKRKLVQQTQQSNRF